jgi:hypothetical protein
MNRKGFFGPLVARCTLRGAVVRTVRSHFPEVKDFPVERTHILEGARPSGGRPLGCFMPGFCCDTRTIASFQDPLIGLLSWEGRRRLTWDQRK